MGTDIAEAVEAQSSPYAIEVHSLMCTQLMKELDRVIKILPEIEAARPRSSGMQSLCLLNNAIEKAKSLLQYCSESSKFYLVLTGDVIQSRCKKSRNLLEQSLSQIQNMVPVMLAAEISRIIADLRSAAFSLDPSEEEAGKVVRAMLQQYATTTHPKEKSVIEAFQFIASRLHITSQKTLLIEKRSIKKLLNKVSDGERPKKQILQFLLNLLNKYGHLFMMGLTEKTWVQYRDFFPVESSCDQFVEVESCTPHGPDGTLSDMSSRHTSPLEFHCPISLRLMYDPVVIDSGQTFERMWIQKWFDEGHDTCPKTEKKLTHLSLTPNTVLKELISKWCVEQGVSIPDPCIGSATIHSWETSSSSIASLSSSMNNLCLPGDFSNVSIGSLDSSESSDFSQIEASYCSNVMLTPTDDDSYKFESFANTHDSSVMFLSKLDALPWESQCKAVEDAKSHLKYTDQACRSISSENFVEPLVRFLKAAHDQQDVKAQRSGCLLLLAVVSKCRSSIQYLTEDAYNLLASFLNSEVIEEALAVMEVLSCHRHCRSKIASPGALTVVLRILDSQIRGLQEMAIKILYNLSLDSDICALIVSFKVIPKLVPYLDDTAFASYSLIILKNLSNNEAARVSIAETDGCIGCIAKLLENDNCEYQEHAVAILLTLCSQRVQYCQLVMAEGVIPALVSVSINGNDKGKVSAHELLRLLRDTEYEDIQDYSESDDVLSRDSNNYSKVKKSSKTNGFFRKISRISKPKFFGS